MAQWPNEQELLEAVRGAGWLLEHHALRVLADAGANPVAGWAFEDPDEPNKSRELDVWAFKLLYHDNTTQVAVNVRFLVECKQSSQPYVGVGHDLPSHRLSRVPEEHVMPRASFEVPLRGDPTRIRFEQAWNHLGLDRVARAHRDSAFRVTQLTRLDRAKGGAWSANNEGVFNSLVYPLAKALQASKKEASPPRPASAGARTGWAHVALHFPVVLLSCPLYVVDATATEPAVGQREWVTAQRDLKSESVTGTFEIDVVTEAAFADYVADRFAFAQSVADAVAEDPLRVTGEDAPPAQR